MSVAYTERRSFQDTAMQAWARAGWSVSEWYYHAVREGTMLLLSASGAQLLGDARRHAGHQQTNVMPALAMTRQLAQDAVRTRLGAVCLLGTIMMPTHVDAMPATQPHSPLRAHTLHRQHLIR